MSSPLTAMPDRFSAGTALEYTRSYPDYPVESGWSVKLYLAGADASTNVNASGGSGGAWQFAIDATTTGAITPGIYRWLERATNGQQIVDLASGYVDVGLDLAQAEAGEALTWAEKTLPLVEAAIAGRLPAGFDSYQIAGRSIAKIPVEELWKLRDRLRIEVRQMRNGGRLGRQHLFDFRRAR